MESVKAGGDDKKELDDSGYVQDEGPHKSFAEIRKLTDLLDLSDDVLLYILSFCRAADLKALGFTCTRLASLIRDRTLWHRVDVRDVPCGRQRLRWLLDHGLHAGTTHLYFKGYAEQCIGCEGYVNGFRKEVEEKYGGHSERPCAMQQHRNWLRDPQNPLPRASSSPSWPDEDPPRTQIKDPNGPYICPGPHFTLTPCLLRRLQQQCRLTHLLVDSCNINCNTTPLSLFPPTLTHLSLRGTRCFNVPNVEKSFLFQIQDHLPNLENLDLSECNWLEPTCLLPLSKLPKLRKLFMTNCPRMTEFVAYASLAGRYGFKKLKVFDLRGSPIGDSEAAALGWLPELEELYLSAHRAPGAQPPAARGRHHHYKDDALPHWRELCHWETHEPEYFKTVLSQKHKRASGDPEQKCFHNLPFYKCTDGLCIEDSRNGRHLKRKNISDEPGPSKRRRSSSSDSNDDEEMNDDDVEMKDVDVSKNSKNVGSSNKNEDIGEGGTGTANNEGNSDDDNNVIGEGNDGMQGNNDQLMNNDIGVQHNNDQREEVQTNNNELGNNIEQPNIRELANNNGQLNNVAQQNVQAEVALERNQAQHNDQPNNGPLLNNEELPNNIEQPIIVLQLNNVQANPVLIRNLDRNNDQPNNGEQPNNINQPNNEAHFNIQAEEALEGNQAQNNDQPNIGEQQINIQHLALIERIRAQLNHNNQPNNEREANNIAQPNNENQLNNNEQQNIVEQPNNEQPNQAQDNRQAGQNENVEARPRAQVLYINLGRQNHPIFRAFLPGAADGPISMEIRMPASHMPTALISDSAIRSFGQSDDDNVNYFHIGGPPNPQNARPSKSNLRVLSVQGYRKITDRSLMHLRTSAPKLEVVDFSETSVTEKGVERFKLVRPDVKVFHSRFVDNDRPLDCRVTVDG